MRMPRTPQAYRALDAFRDAPRSERLKVKARWILGSIVDVEKQVPRAGRILDVGCGHGALALYLAVCSPDRQVVGVDIDEDRIALARQAAAHLGEGAGTVDFQTVEPGEVPEGPFDVVITSYGLGHLRHHVQVVR